MHRTATHIAALTAIAISLGAIPRLASPSVGRAQRIDESPCIPTFTKAVSPDAVQLGDSVAITLHARVTCPTETITSHIALVLDTTGSMTGRPIAELRAAASQFVRDLDLPHDPSVRVGVAEFNDRARTLAPLTNDEATALDAIARLQPTGGTRIDLGIDEGVRILREGRSGESAITETIIVLSDGGNNAGCDPVRASADRARQDGIHVVTICVGLACDEVCIRLAAGEARNYHAIDDTAELGRTFGEIRRHIRGINGARMTIVDTLPDHMRYVPESADPPPTSSDLEPWIAWETAWVPRDGLTVTFRAEPLLTGVLDANLEARGTLVDLQGRTREWAFGIPTVTVLEPADATPAPPVASDCTASGSLRAQPERVHAGDEVTITHRVRATCPAKPLHIVLVLDGSAGMAGEAREWAIGAAQGIVRSLDLAAHPTAKVGVVVFNSAASTLTPLTSDASAALAAIDRLSATDGSRIDAGIVEGMRTLRLGRGGASATEMLLLISNGRSDVGCAPPLLAARQARGQGMLVATLGACPDCDRECLASLASAPDYVYARGADWSSPLPWIELRDRTPVRVRQLVADGVLSPDVVYVPDSAVPPFAIAPPDARYRWKATSIPPEGLTLTLRVRPLRAGRVSPVYDAASALIDSVGRDRAIRLGSPSIDVAPPGTPSTAPTVEPTRIPAPHRWFLPIALVGTNCPCYPAMDLAIVLDASPSMGESVTGDARTKLEIARDAASTLVATADRRDRIALVVSSGETPSVEAPTLDRAAIGRAIAAARIGTGSRLDAGLRAAADALSRPTSGTGYYEQGIVVVSDGRVASPQALAAAIQESRAVPGRAHVVLAVGDDADVGLLRELVWSERHLLRLPADLSAVIRSMRIPCPECPEWP